MLSWRTPNAQESATWEWYWSENCPSRHTSRTSPELTSSTSGTKPITCWADLPASHQCLHPVWTTAMPSLWGICCKKKDIVWQCCAVFWLWNTLPQRGGPSAEGSPTTVGGMVASWRESLEKAVAGVGGGRAVNTSGAACSPSCCYYYYHYKRRDGGGKGGEGSLLLSL